MKTLKIYSIVFLILVGWQRVKEVILAISVVKESLEFLVLKEQEDLLADEEKKEILVHGRFFVKKMLHKSEIQFFVFLNFFRGDFGQDARPGIKGYRGDRGLKGQRGSSNGWAEPGEEGERFLFSLSFKFSSISFYRFIWQRRISRTTRNNWYEISSLNEKFKIFN